MTYTIMVTNTGPSTSPARRWPTPCPADLTGVTWTATATGGATGFTATGSGNINDTRQPAGGQHVTYTVTGTIDPSATGTPDQHGHGDAPAGVTDTNSGQQHAPPTPTR